MRTDAAQPSGGALLKAIFVAALFASALDVAIHYWRTPLGWSDRMVIGSFLLNLLFEFVVLAAVGLLFGQPLGRWGARRNRFRPVVLTVGGALIGSFAAILASALGNTYHFMSGPGFWQSFVVAGFAGGVTGYLWFRFSAKTSIANA